MGAVKVQHVGLETGDLETNAVILALFGQLFVVGLADDLVGAVAGLLQQLVGIPDDVVAAQICTVQDVFGLLVGLADDVFAHALRIDEGALEHIAVCLIALHIAAQGLVLGSQVGYLLAQGLHLFRILPELLFYLIQKVVNILGTVAAEVLFELDRAHVLRCQHNDLLHFIQLSFSILEELNDLSVFFALARQSCEAEAPFAPHCEHIRFVYRRMGTGNGQMVDLYPSRCHKLCGHAPAAPQHSGKYGIQTQRRYGRGL